MTHIYYNPITQRNNASVTTILGVVDKPWLRDWYAKMEREKAASLFWAAYHGLRKFENEEAVLAYLNEHKGEAKRKSQEAMGLGSLVHGFCDAYWQVWIDEENPYPQSVESYLGFISDLFSTEVVKMVGAYFRCLKEEKITVLSTEQTVHSIYGYSGTLDLIARVDGVLSVIDIKTGDPDRIGPPIIPQLTYRVQLEAYRRCAKYDTMEPSGRGIIYLRKGKHAGKYLFWFEDLHPEHNENDWKFFLSAKTIYDMMEEK